MRVLPRVGKYVLLALLDRSLHIVAHSAGESESSLGEYAYTYINIYTFESIPTHSQGPSHP